MAFVSHSHSGGFSIRLSGRRLPRLVLPVCGLGALFGAASLFHAGHPFLAVWAVTALFGWLLLAGAAKGSDQRGQ